ncbi:hypothetical protein BpHYR1_047187 [Brachionus plicatilis]|uniref:Uncharacterized protein n=1 Tax=Brachionus plicatilis TaxID=10195 RepID=A0A3M7PIK5_BRAPC|nr:hypothetical protein BpHYR1_047187 [Brachionus plicatilis]
MKFFYFELVYLVTAFVPSLTACLANSPVILAFEYKYYEQNKGQKLKVTKILTIYIFDEIKLKPLEQFQGHLLVSSRILNC